MTIKTLMDLQVDMNAYNITNGVGLSRSGIHVTPDRLSEVAALPKIGYGRATAHHGEILQGVFEEPEGRLRRGLVTLPCGLMQSVAVFHKEVDATSITSNPPWKTKALRAAELTLDYFGLSQYGGNLKIHSTIPVGWGFGSSTSDVTASIRAVARAFGIKLTSTVIARLAVKAEIASDSIMHEERAVLFAQRDGIVIENFSGPLPSLRIVGFNTESICSGIDTLTLPPARYTWQEIETFRLLRGLMRRAIYTQDRSLIGRVASASAHINQARLSKPYFDKLERLVEEVGALGIQVAHSGTVAGLLFDPQDANLWERIRETQASLAEMGFGQTWHFSNVCE